MPQVSAMVMEVVVNTITIRGNSDSDISKAKSSPYCFRKDREGYQAAEYGESIAAEGFMTKKSGLLMWKR
jgi:hypothetical protein